MNAPAFSASALVNRDREGAVQQSAFPDSPADADRLAAFKHATAAKLRTAVCPVHGRLPVLRFQGASIRDVTINVSGCCDVLLSIANRAVANR